MTAEPPGTPPRRSAATGPVWGAAYALIALLFVAGAAYMRLDRGAGLMTPQVLFPSLGAVWFAFRAAFAFFARPR